MGPGSRYLTSFPDQCSFYKIIAPYSLSYSALTDYIQVFYRFWFYITTNKELQKNVTSLDLFILLYSCMFMKHKQFKVDIFIH